MLLFILMTALLATELYEPTLYDDVRYYSGKWSDWKLAIKDEYTLLQRNTV